MGFVKAIMRLFRGKNSQPGVVLLSIRSISHDEFSFPQVKNSVRLLSVPEKNISGYQAINSASERNSSEDTFNKTIPTEKDIPPFPTEIIPATVETTPAVRFSSILVDCDEIYKIERDELIRERDELKSDPDSVSQACEDLPLLVPKGHPFDDETKGIESTIKTRKAKRNRAALLRRKRSKQAEKMRSSDAASSDVLPTSGVADEPSLNPTETERAPESISAATILYSTSQAADKVVTVGKVLLNLINSFHSEPWNLINDDSVPAVAESISFLNQTEADTPVKEIITTANASDSVVLDTEDGCHNNSDLSLCDAEVDEVDEDAIKAAKMKAKKAKKNRALLEKRKAKKECKKQQISEAILPEDLPTSATPQLSENSTVTESVLATEDSYLPHVIPVLTETEETPDSATDKDPIYDIKSVLQPNQPSVPNVEFIHVTNLPVSLPGQTLVWYLETLVGPVKCCTLNLDENHLYCGKATVSFWNPGDAIRAFLFCQPMVIEGHEIEIELVVNEKRLSPSEAMVMYPKIQLI